MMISTALWLLTSGPLALAGSADSRDNELSVGMGVLGTRGDNWGVVEDDGQLLSGGLRGGLALSEHLTLLAGYQLGISGGDAEVYDYEGAYGYDYLDLDLSLTAHQLSLGPKVDLQVRHWLRPYATVQALGVLGTLRLDDDPSDEDVGLRRYRSLTPGGVAALGLDLVGGRPRAAVHPAFNLELGYGLTANMRFSDRDAGPEPIDLGTLGMGGFYMRWGVGVHF